MDTEIPPSLTPSLGDQPSASPRPPAWLSILALIVGLGAAVLGPTAGGLYIILSLVARHKTDALTVTTVGVSVAALGLGVGSALAWAGYGGLHGRPSRPFRPGGLWLGACLVGWTLAVVVGQAIISLNMAAPVTFPLFHVAGMALPAIAILALTGRALGLGMGTSLPTRRQVVGQVALGTMGVTAVAFMLEAALVLIGAVVVAVIIALLPGGQAQLAELRALVTNPARLQDTQTLSRWLLKPGILISVVGLVVVAVPLIEEAAKSSGVPLLALALRRAPAPAQGWVWGVAVGTGFAIAEGLFNGAASQMFWAGIVVLRVGSTIMHTTAAGLTGLGWARVLASGRPLRLFSGRAWPLLGSYLASVTLHGLWNGATVLIAVSSVWTATHSGSPAAMLLGGLGAMAGLAGLALLALGMLAVALAVTLRLKQG